MYRVAWFVEQEIVGCPDRIVRNRGCLRTPCPESRHRIIGPFRYLSSQEERRERLLDDQWSH
jgi:hypothetical protein